VHYWRSLGPGLVTGASDNDPSGIGTYSVAGASTRYGLLWMAPLTMPLLVAVQSMAARIGACKEEGLGRVIQDRFGRRVLIGSVTILLVANGPALGRDLLVLPTIRQPSEVADPGALPVHRLGDRGRPPRGEVLKGTFVPHLTFSKDYLSSAVAILGTTISPYMFFWITSQEVQEEEEHAGADLDDDPATALQEERKRRLDVITGMAYANLVFYFIILSSAATLGKRGIKIETASQAAAALTPIVGRFDTVLFAVGMTGAGLIAIPVLAGAAAYPLVELFGWREGLDHPLKQAPGFYAALSAAVALGVGLNFLGVSPVKALVYPRSSRASWRRSS
jgi:Mn2+/Fe2+ NRAMP family transporter